MTLKNRFPKLFGLLFLFTALVMAIGLFSYGSQPAAAQAKAKYVILFIGDGMGQEHVKAGRYFNDTDLYFEAFPRQTLVYHNNARNCTTDSAASGTAMATGVKVNQGVISWKPLENPPVPNDTNELKTLLEIYKEAGRRTGLVTTSYVTDATPAAFGAHNSDRDNRTDIFADYLNSSQPNVLFGAVGSNKGVDITSANASGSPYSGHVATNKTQMDALTGTHVAGFFGSGESVLEPEGIANRPATVPTLPQMTAKALELLDNDQGFFLLVEDEGTDQWSHLHYTEDANASAEERVVRTVVELAEAVKTAETWLTAKGYMAEALILVTADHETGGLSVTENPDSLLPNMVWRSSAFDDSTFKEEAAHTQEAVPLYAEGLGADQITPGLPLQNNNLFTILHPTERLGLVNSAPIAGSVDYCIWDKADDAEEKISSGNMLLTQEQLDLGVFINQNGGRAQQAVGLRFRDLNIPPQTNIHSAYLEFEVAKAGSEVTNLTISAEDTDDALLFTTTTNNITTRTLTTANVGWQINTSWAVDDVVRSPDLKNVLQEVVNRNDWERLNDIVLVLTGSGSRVVGAFDNELWSAPRLHIESGDWHGSISIVERASPAEDTVFNYSSVQLGNFTLADPGNKTKVFSELGAGTYQVSHALPWPWYVDIWCSSDQGRQVLIDTSDVWNLALTINLELGENVSCTFEHTRFTPPLGAPGEGELYLSTGMAGTVGSVTYAAGDLLFLDNEGTWYNFPLYSDVNGIAAVRYGGACFAFSVPKILVGTDPEGVTPQDVACWNPIFPNGYFELWFDGSDVGLVEGGEAIDALHFFSEGDMLISTSGNFSVANDTITGRNEDILRFTFSNPGENTVGTWSLALDGSTVSGMGAEDLTGLWVDEETGDYYLAFEDEFTIKGVNGSANDVLKLHKSNNVWSASLAWQGAEHGFSGYVRGLEMGPVPHLGLVIGRRPPKP